MSETYLLVDLENVQPEPDEVRSWVEKHGPVRIFHGKNQAKLLSPFEALGERVDFIPTARSGKNALDFHLVFQLGYIAASNAGSRFAILSKDKGYDPVIEHARSLKLKVSRRHSITQGAESKGAKTSEPPKKSTPSAKAATKKKAAVTGQRASGKKQVPPTETAATGKVVADPYERFVAVLREQPKNRPGNRRALERHIRTFLGANAAPTAHQDLIARLIHQRLVQFDGERIEYKIS